MNFKTTKLTPKIIIATLLLLISLPNWAGNISVADNYFLQKKYDLAIKEYLDVAQIGNPTAYYQLGVIYDQGLGTNTDSLKALIWFSLSAEYGYEDSAELAEQLLANISAEQRDQAIALVSYFQKSFGKENIDNRYYPKLITKNVESKIYFGEKKGQHGADFIIDENIISDSSNAENIIEENLNDTIDPFDEDEMDNNADIQHLATQGSYNRLLGGPSFLIADYDIAPDGSIRNITPVQTIGIADKTIKNLKYNQLPTPKFIDKGVHFVNRSYLGIAGYDKLRIRREHQALYYRVKKKLSKYSKSNLPQDQYKHAMLLINFPWLTQEEGEADKLLKNAAEHGHTIAKYEYGLKLYRDQIDIDQAIYWLSEATKQGNSNAQYRLARILLDSPWVVNDEKKASFWLEEAMKQKHPHAKLKLAELKLLASDKKLHDVNNAVLFLKELKIEQENNPQYLYLQAMAHAKMEPRKLSEAFIYMREAIELGNNFHWDVEPWRQQLNKWTGGTRITIQEL
jgi:TPR repeat protein